MRSFPLYWGILLLFVISPAYYSYAQPIDITAPVEQKFYQGNPDQIKEFVKGYEAKVKKLISELNLIQKEKLSGQERKDLLDALELLEGLSFQFTRLKREISAPEYTPVALPVIGVPPYKLQDLDRYLSLYQQLIQRLGEYKKQLSVTSADISEINQQLKQIFIQYLDLKKDPAKKIKAYNLLAQLMSLQVEYALKMTKNFRLNRAIKRLIPRINECKENMSKVFDNLRIDKSDIELLLKKKKKIAKEEESLRERILSEGRKLNKKITLFELRLDSLINKLSSAQVSEAGRRLLKVEKERIETYLNRLQYKREMLNQEGVLLRLKKAAIDFKYDWVTNYSGYAGHKKTELIIVKWGNKLKDIKTEIKQLKEKLDQMRFDLSILNERMVRIKKEMETEPDQQVKDSLKSLYNELEQNKDYLDKLIDRLSSNLAYSKSVAWSIEELLLLIKNRISPLERVSYKVKGNLHNVWLSIKGIICYPLWSIGGNVITIVTILKIIFFLCLGIYLLRVVKKRLSKFLIEKMGLSVGLVNSISTLIYYFLLILVIFIALSTAGVNLSQITIILGALGVGIGFGLQTIANNFISGLILLTERTIKVGDIVELENGLIGRVKDVSIRSTVIRSYDGLDIIVPNSDFIANKVTTWTYGDDWRRLRIPFGVSYGSDPERVAEIAKEVARQIPTTMEDRDHPVSVWFEGFGDSSLDFSLLVWCRMRDLKPVTGLISDYYFALFKRFKEEGIEIPFPQRDLHIRSMPASVEDVLEKVKKGEEDDKV